MAEHEAVRLWFYNRREFLSMRYVANMVGMDASQFRKVLVQHTTPSGAPYLFPASVVPRLINISGVLGVPLKLPRKGRKSPSKSKTSP